MSGGLAIAGRLVPVPGVAVVPPATLGGPAWAKLDARDYRMRRTTWVRQVIPHSVTGDWPQVLVPGPGPGGEAVRYADIWRSDPTSSAAHLLVDSAGTVVCLCDLAYTCAYHAEGSNDWAVGIEMFVAKDGTIRGATIDATAATIEAICTAMSIPFQFHGAHYRDEPLARMETFENGHRRSLGGPDCVGIFGHRDNTRTRGRGDPGDAIYAALAARGAEGLDYATRQDIDVGQVRQRALNERGGRLKIDGLIGPASITEARRQGFASWRNVPS